MRITNIVKNYMKRKRIKKRFKNDCEIYEKENNNSDFKIKMDETYPVYEDEEPAGRLDEHYFLQDIWMAKQIRANCSGEHYDIGSRVDGFIAHLLSMDIRVTLIDIRKLDIDIANLDFMQGDATNLSSIPNEYIDSLSSLHAIEHFGLGRYGDSIDPEAWKKVLHSFERVLKKGGLLYISVPVGEKNHVVYNAHRIFVPDSIIKELSNMELIKFAYIENFKIYEVDIFEKIMDSMAGKDYLCGCFVFRKI